MGTSCVLSKGFKINMRGEISAARIFKSANILMIFHRLQSVTKGAPISIIQNKGGAFTGGDMSADLGGYGLRLRTDLENITFLCILNPFLQLWAKKSLSRGLAPKKQPPALSAWVFLPFHLAWARCCFQKILTDVQKKPGMQRLLADSFYPKFVHARIAWKVGCKHFVTFTTKNSEEQRG